MSRMLLNVSRTSAFSKLSSEKSYKRVIKFKHCFSIQWTVKNCVKMNSLTLEPFSISSLYLCLREAVSILDCSVSALALDIFAMNGKFR